MLVETKAVILLDDNSKSVIKTSISEIGADGFRFISSLDEINDEVLRDSRKLVILEGFAQTENSILDLELYRKLYELDIYFLGSGKYFRIYETVASCFECDISVITNKTIQAALFEDSSLEDRGTIDRFDAYDNAKRLLAEKESHDAAVSQVAASFISLQDKINFYESQSKILEDKNKILTVENDKLLNDRKLLLDGYRQMITEAGDLNRALKKYERIFSQDIYDKVRVHEYPNKPMIIYFKEYEDFINLEEMLETLYSVFQLQARQSVKILRLFDSGTSRKMELLPRHYKVIRNKYVMTDIVAADFIAKSGDYRRILEKILLNEAGLDILVIVDSKNFDDIVLTGVPLQLNLCREKKHSILFGLHENSTILNDRDARADLFWGQYDTDGMEKNEKFLFLSSRPVIQNILSLTRAFNQSV